MKFYSSQYSLETIDQWPAQLKWFMAASLFSCCLSLGYWFYLNPSSQHLKQQYLQEQRLKQNYKTKQLQASHYIAYKQQLHLLQTHLAHLELGLPKTKQLYHLLNLISQAGIESGLTLNAIKPRPPNQHALYRERLILLQATGNYQQLLTFISKITAPQSLLSLEDFVIEATEPSHPKAQPLLMAQMTLKVVQPITSETQP